MTNKSNIFRLEITVALVLVALLWWGAAYKIRILRDEARRGVAIKNINRISDAIAVHRGDHRGACPRRLEDLLENHLDKIPSHYSRSGKKSERVQNGAYSDVYDGGGGWIYVNDPEDKDYCKVLPNAE
jgi:type II secretory pathway pseudopilin PulG